MKLFKKTTGFLLAAAMVLSMMPEYVQAKEEITETVNVSTFQESTDNVACVAVTGGSVATVKKDGVYEFTGSAAGFAIEVKKNVTATLVLNELTIDNSALASESEIESTISCKAGSKVTIALAGENTLKQNPANSTLENGVKHAKASSKNGSGSVTFQEYETGGTLNIDSTYEDAIKFKSDDETAAIVNIEGGSINITNCYGDGIQAETVNISGGELNIETAYQNASTQYYTSGSSSVAQKNTIWENGNTKYERVNVDTGSHKGIKAGTKAKTEKYSDTGETDVTSASGGLFISGGTITINTTKTGLKANKMGTSGYSATSTGVYIIGSPDDAIQSNNTLSITGGNLTLSSSDDGISSANGLTITGTPVINILSAFEGLEGKDITIGSQGQMEGPTLSIVSDDDGINAACKTVTYTYDSSEDEDCNYLKTSVSSDSGCTCNIYSGSVNIKIDTNNSKSRTLGQKTITYYAAGDGIDCNGTLDIEGGSHTIFGQSSGDNSPIDTNNGFTLGSSATVFAAGTDGMNETAPESGNGVYLYATATGSVTALAAGSGNNGQGGGFGGGGMGDPGQGGPGQGEPGQGAPGQGDPGQGGPGMNEQDSAFSAGSTITIKSGTTTLVSQTIPYNASVIFYAAPGLTAGSSYTVETGTGSDAANDQVQQDENQDADQEDAAEDSSSGNGSTSDNVVLTTDGTVKKGTVLYGTDADGNAVKVKITKKTKKYKKVAYKVTAATSSLTIPDTVTINGTVYKVTAIMAKSCKNNKTLESVTIGSNVMIIGKQAFYGCEYLTDILFEGSKVTSIGTGAFKKIGTSAEVRITAVKKRFKAIRKLIKASGAPKKTSYKRIAP